MPSRSLSFTSVEVLRFLILFDDLLVRRWLLYPFPLLILPVAVTLNRFAAPLWVFNFGISSSIKNMRAISRTGYSSLRQSVLPDRCGNENINYTLKKNICHGYFKPPRESRGETDNR